MFAKLKSHVALILLTVFLVLAPSLANNALFGVRHEPEEPTVNVLVAKRNLARHTVINHPERFFDVQSVSSAQSPGDALHSLQQIDRERLLNPVSEGSIIRQSDLDPSPSELFYTFPSGHRPKSIWVDRYYDLSEEANEEPIIEPGVRVDILIHGLPFMDDRLSLFIASNVLLLATDSVRIGEEEKTPVIVTVSASPDLGLLLRIAQKLGKLRIKLSAVHSPS
jgi:Flp pilus assembly protein CpaB